MSATQWENKNLCMKKEKKMLEKLIVDSYCNFI